MVAAAPPSRPVLTYIVSTAPEPLMTRLFVSRVLWKPALFVKRSDLMAFANPASTTLFDEPFAPDVPVVSTSAKTTSSAVVGLEGDQLLGVLQSLSPAAPLQVVVAAEARLMVRMIALASSASDLNRGVVVFMSGDWMGRCLVQFKCVVLLVAK